MISGGSHPLDQQEIETLKAELAEAKDLLADVVVKATEFGEQDGGFIANYILPTGPIHRIIPWLDNRGITVRPGFDFRETCQPDEPPVNTQPPALYRVGGKQPRNLYRIDDNQDTYIGVCFDPNDTAHIVAVLNSQLPADRAVVDAAVDVVRVWREWRRGPRPGQPIIPIRALALAVDVRALAPAAAALNAQPAPTNTQTE